MVEQERFCEGNKSWAFEMRVCQVVQRSVSGGRTGIKSNKGSEEANGLEFEF